MGGVDWDRDAVSERMQQMQSGLDEARRKVDAECRQKEVNAAIVEKQLAEREQKKRVPSLQERLADWDALATTTDGEISDALLEAVGVIREFLRSDKNIRDNNDWLLEKHRTLVRALAESRRAWNYVCELLDGRQQ